MKSSSHRDISFTPPMECLPVANLPDGPGWVYELKLDGYRGQAFRDHRGVHLLTRRGKDFSRKFARVFDAMKDSIPIGAAVDRELVAFEETGQLSFNALQNADADTNVVFFAFDILMHNWRDTKHLPLGERKALLAKAIRPSDRVQVSEHFGGPIGKFLKAVREMGGEGVVAKRLESHYEPGRRSGAWSKKRLNIGQEFVIRGFTPASNGVDALVVGFYEGRRLMYAARVRSGLVPATRRDLYARMQSRISPDCPFANLPEAKSGRWGQGLTAAKMKQCIWVRPELVANFEFLEWTDSNHVGHIKFVALREDKDPRKVVRERRIRTQGRSP